MLPLVLMQTLDLHIVQSPRVDRHTATTITIIGNPPKAILFSSLICMKAFKDIFCIGL